MEQVQRIIHMGYEKVVFNSSLWLNPDVVKKAVSYLGSSGVVASIDVKLVDDHYVAMISGGQIQLPIDLMQYLKQILSYQVGEIIINRIEFDSAMTGYDETLIEFISSNCDVPVIALGGAGSIQDFKRAINAGAHAAGASSIFVYFGAKRTVLITHPSQKDIVQLWAKVDA
jgi:cyclase